MTDAPQTAEKRVFRYAGEVRLDGSVDWGDFGSPPEGTLVYFRIYTQADIDIDEAEAEKLWEGLGNG